MEISILGAPVSAGAYAPGQEKTPSALRSAGLLSALTQAGLELTDLGDIDPFRWCPDRANPHAMNVQAVARSVSQVAERLSPVFAEDGRALVIGGDCTVEIGTVAAAAAHSENFGLIYFDLDADLNTPSSTSDGALDWMGVAHMLRIDGIETTVIDTLGPAPLLKPSHLLYFATGNVKPFEREIINRLDIAEIPLGEVLSDPCDACRRALQWASGFDRLLIHIDVDVLDYAKYPLAENTRRGIGLDYAQLIICLSQLVRSPNWRVLTLTEINPDHCADPAADLSKLAVDLATLLAAPLLEEAHQG